MARTRWALFAAVVAIEAQGCVFFPAPTFGDVPSRDATIDGTIDAQPTDAPLDGPCAPGRLDCDESTVNGCETAESVANCGQCGAVCVLPSAFPRCVSGQCAIDRCQQGFGDCDNTPSNGCEQRVDTPEHCGACGNRCSGGTPLCVDGRCSSGCPANQLRCGGACVDVTASNEHCGACNNACTPAANGQRQCGGGACVLRCNSGFADCNMNAADGCETTLGTTENCTRCGEVCRGATPTCNTSAGACTGALCASPLLTCGSACVDPNTSTAHCGRCTNACPSLPNSTAMCAGGSCRNPCLPGFGDCTMAPGCETALNTAENCGMCGARCGFPNATAACVMGACAMGACNPGFGNCDGDPANGCETPLDSVRNCGRCGSVCSTARATSACVAGVCRITACNPGFGDCDDNAGNGCETSLNTVRDCGACGAVCPTRPGGCAPECSPGDPPSCQCV
ncbi:MAG: hypothetical protein JNK05_16450 [Myxococcales bacterium]|nr:hypothetical protein [Myxococcales bacterium]